MKDVVCYRSNNIEELRKISKIRNISLSTITAEIIDDYLHNHTLVKKYNMFSDGKKFLSAAFENLEPTVFEKIATIGAAECSRSAKMSMNNFSLENLLDYFRGWIEINNLKLSEFDENVRIRWVCETNMGKNYNKICGNCFEKVLGNFGFSVNIESISYEDFEIIISKQKS